MDRPTVSVDTRHQDNAYRIRASIMENVSKSSIRPSRPQRGNIRPPDDLYELRRDYRMRKRNIERVLLYGATKEISKDTFPTY
ncbi:hypothetical protein HZH66_009639 [Vespula vulgaris]|uniref:Uncharacterized protein n=1 Tax=Vespula vulgaris TaxID=7454 RepID=A0A834N141_VESVU|nr:hypothetical protein HZH66_009639 [Vespula vulgaris]